MSDALDSLTGLIIPLAGPPLLVPNVAVAELVGYRLSEASPEGPEWFLGWTRWRDQRIPVIDPGVMLGQPANDGQAPRMVILNAVGGRPGVHFLGLRVSGIPRTKRVVRGEMQTAGAGGGFVSRQVRLADEEELLLIPDLEAMERALGLA